MAHTRNILFAVLCLALTGFTSAKLPSYLKVCKRDQNTIDECVQKSIEDLRPYLAKGIPEMSVPRAEPLDIDEVKLDILNGDIKNLKLYGLTTIEFKKIKVDLQAMVIKATVSAAVVSFTGDASANVEILSVPIKGKGPVSANLTDSELDVVIKYKIANRDGQEFVEFTSCDDKLRVGDYYVSLDAVLGGNPALASAASQMLRQSKQDVFSMVQPLIETVVCRVVVEMGNKIAGSEPYPTLLPPV